jgi:endonuclease YncB( thermonuclease family)
MPAANQKKARSLVPLLGLLLLIPSLLVNAYFLKKTRPPVTVQETELLAVSDGDSLVLTDGRQVRLRHVDAPELGFCGGQEAKDLLTKLVKGKSLTISEEVTDYHGRPLALVYAGGNLVNLAMVESGWARHHNDTSSVAPQLREAANRAREGSLGIFSPLCYQKENTGNPACNVKGNIDKQSGDKRFYTPACAQYKFTIIEKDIGESWFCSEKEALAAGFSKAATCR